MKIISPFKDYYDYMAYVYGIDDKHVYVRPKTLILPESVIPVDPGQNLYQIPMAYSHRNSHVHTGIMLWEANNKFLELYDPMIISFCGYPIPVVFDIKRQKYLVTTEKVWEEIYENIYETKESLERGKRLVKLFSEGKFGKTDALPQFEVRSNSLVHLSRVLGQPVFIAPSFLNNPKGFRSSSTIVTFHSLEIPMLSKYGFASVISPDQAYQELDYFIGNLMNESPDLAPPVKVSDKDKIVQHGFDLKTSFRGK